MNMFYDEKITFDTEFAAEMYLAKLLNIAISKHYVTAAEIYEGLGMPAGERDHEFGFDVNSVRAANIFQRDGKWMFEIHGMKPVLNSTTIKPVEPKPSTSTPEPLYITIHVNEIDVYDPDEIISDVFKHISQIKDRVVNVSIM